MTKTAQGTPTKEFFVGMLTRDIDLNDAILDLLDNCLDGVVRQKREDENRSSIDYYKGYYAHITINSDRFVIEDNCGGIPQEIAEKRAFRMGRLKGEIDDDLPTVGIYGIGMKRAIFKIGKSANVITRNNGMLYQVIIPSNWAQSEEWDFTIEDIKDDSVLSAGGTKIEVSDINSGIAGSWENDIKLGEFIDRLFKAIQQSYSFIAHKGFEIKINGRCVDPLPIQLLSSEGSDGIQPFLYQQTFNDVKVRLAVGFYASPPSTDEIDEGNELKRSSSDAGWTIICNDRVVLYNDKSHLTGWGEAGVPHYHTQFIGIRGIVLFESKNPQNLPMTTTKRGIDTSSNIYSAVKDKMRQGLKMFTDYTNKWKGRNEIERVYSSAAKKIPVEHFISSEVEDKVNVIKLRRYNDAYIYNPKLPSPPNDKAYRRICFNRGIDEINDIIEYLYNDRSIDIKPSLVGEKCFDKVLEASRNQKEFL